jgi:glycosyltransferase involved in cell wall biosynthesis
MIFLDVTGACKSPRSTGIQRITRCIFQELNGRASVMPISWNSVGNRYQLLGRRERALLEEPARFLTRARARPELRGEYFPAELHRHIFRKSIRLQKQLRAGDVFLLPDIFRDGRLKKLPILISRADVRSVAIFHDAAVLQLSMLDSRAKAKFEKYILSLTRFDLVICVSEASREDLRQLWSELGASPTETVVEIWPIEPVVQSPNRALRDAQPLVLCVGSFERRKNHVTLLRAANAAWESGLEFELELIGRSTGAFGRKVTAELRKLRRSARPVRWLKQVNDEVLQQAYQACRFTVYPSLMEGFGLPIAESLIHGKPCICGGNGALGEVARGGGCLVIDQTKSESLADAIKTLLADRELYSRLCDEARARKFRSWLDYTDKLLAHLQPKASRQKVSAVS